MNWKNAVDRTYWHKQLATQPLFPELLWSRPENRMYAGKLAVIGGNLHGFAAPAQAYNDAQTAGIGTARALLPDAVRKIIGNFLENAEFAPSTPSGSFAQAALNEWLSLAAWADGTLLAGDLGRNSETAIVLESFLQKSPEAVALTKDALDYVLETPQLVIDRPRTLIVGSVAQIQKLVQNSGSTTAIRFSMDLLQMIEALHTFTSEHTVLIVTKHLDTLLVAYDGQVSTTRLPDDLQVWRLHVAAGAAVWWLQQPQKPFEAVTTAVATIANPHTTS